MIPPELARQSATTDHRHRRAAGTHARPCRPGQAVPGDPSGRPTVSVREAADGSRMSTVRRPDGSSFTVSVPPGALDDESAGSAGGWIVGDPPADAHPAALARLADLVMGAAGPALPVRRHEGPARRHRLAR